MTGPISRASKTSGTEEWVRVIHEGKGYSALSARVLRQYLEDTDHYLFFEALLRYAKPESPVLEAGCGWAISSFALAQRGFRTVAVDISPELMKRLREVQRELGGREKEYLELVEGDIFHLDSLNRKFGLIFSDGTYEHFLKARERRDLLASFFRALQEDGKLILAVPNLGNPFFGAVVAQTMPAMHSFTIDELIAEMEGGGFHVLEKGYAFVNAGFRQWLRSGWMAYPVLFVNSIFRSLPPFLQRSLAVHLYCVARKKTG